LWPEVDPAGRNVTTVAGQAQAGVCSLTRRGAADLVLPKDLHDQHLHPGQVDLDPRHQRPHPAWLDGIGGNTMRVCHHRLQDYAPRTCSLAFLECAVIDPPGGVAGGRCWPGRHGRLPYLR
jgi:hypothetical protein